MTVGRGSSGREDVVGNGRCREQYENLTQTKGRSSLVAPGHTGTKRKPGTGARVGVISWSEGGSKALAGCRGEIAARS